MSRSSCHCRRVTCRRVTVTSLSLCHVHHVTVKPDKFTKTGNPPGHLQLERMYILINCHGSEGGSRQYPNRDVCRNCDQDSRYRDNLNQSTPPSDLVASRGDRPAQGGSNEYSQFQSRGDRPGAPSGDNKMDFRGRGGPPGDNKMDFRGRGAPSGDSKMEFRGRGGPPADRRMDFQGQRERLGDVGKGDYQGRRPPSDNGFQGRGGQSGGQEDNRARPGATDKNDSGVSSNRIGQDKSGSGQGDGEDKKVEVKMEDIKQSLLGSKPPPHDVQASGVKMGGGGSFSVM